jgi:hypothetical protein
MCHHTHWRILSLVQLEFIFQFYNTILINGVEPLFKRYQSRHAETCAKQDAYTSLFLIPLLDMPPPPPRTKVSEDKNAHE